MRQACFHNTRDYIIPYIVHLPDCYVIHILPSDSRSQIRIIRALCDKTVYQTLFSGKLRHGLSIVFVLDVHVHFHQYFVYKLQGIGLSIKVSIYEVISVCNPTLYTCSADGILHVHGTWTICDSWKQAARQAFTVHKTILYHRPSAWLLTSWMSSQYHHRVGTMALAVFAVPPVRRNPARCSVMFRGAWMAESRAFLQFTQAWKQR